MKKSESLKKTREGRREKQRQLGMDEMNTVEKAKIESCGC